MSRNAQTWQRTAAFLVHHVLEPGADPILLYRSAIEKIARVLLDDGWTIDEIMVELDILAVSYGAALVCAREQQEVLN